MQCFHLRSSKIDVDLRRSMYRLSKIDDDGSMCRLSRIDDRCVDLRRWMIDVPTFEDRWSLCRPSKTDDRCEIMLLHLLKTLMVYLYGNNCAEGLHFSAFIIIVNTLNSCSAQADYYYNYTRCGVSTDRTRMRKVQCACANIVGVIT